MLKRKSSIIFTLLLFFFLVTFSLGATPTPDAATLEKYTNDYLANICSGHGGVNCSIINSDASIVCNDGTIDASLISIYAVPQCQESIRYMTDEQSIFMAETGCFPPSELRCINNISYNNLYSRISSSGLINSELGRNELTQCQRQINEFNNDEKNYRQCLINNNRSDFELSGKIILPILKAVSCPIFYGNKASYDAALDLCVCEKGYFMHNEQCVAADQICKIKHGADFYSQNGNCIQRAPSPSFNPVESIPAPTILITPSITANTLPSTYIPPTRIATEFTNYQIESTTTDTSAPKIGIIRGVLNSIISGIKNFINLF